MRKIGLVAMFVGQIDVFWGGREGSEVEISAAAVPHELDDGWQWAVDAARIVSQAEIRPMLVVERSRSRPISSRT